MTDRELKDEATALRREILELKSRVQRVKDTYREIEVITQELKRQIAV